MSDLGTQMATGADSLLVADDVETEVERSIRDLLSRLRRREKTAVVLCDKSKEPYAVLMLPQHFDLLDAIVSIAIDSSAIESLQLEDVEAEENLLSHEALKQQVED